MKQCLKCSETKPFEAFPLEPRMRGGRRSECQACRTKDTLKRRAQNREAYNAYMREYNSKHLDPVKESKRQAQKYLRHKQKINERNGGWRKENPAIVAAHSARYKAAKWQRTPKWLTSKQLQEIEVFYREAAQRTRTGIEYEVDHIVPLRGKNVSGLHVPWNLQILEKCGPNGNRAKRNKVA